MNVVLVFFFGGLGAVLRYLIGISLARPDGAAFPWATLLVNVIGCGVAGFLSWLSLGRGVLTDSQRAALMVGLLGGFTTFSAFGVETLGLLRDGRVAAAAANAIANVSLGLLGALAGWSAGRTWASP